jgi:putative acetyltransferase
MRANDVVGHILFSRVFIEAPNQVPAAAALAPMAVLPEWQRRGIGSSPVRAGLLACGESGESIAIVGSNVSPSFRII